MKVIVLGAGLVGGPMALDLAHNKDFQVTVADINQEALQKVAAADPRITILLSDLSQADSLRTLIADYDLVLSAVPGFMGYSTLETIIQAGKNVVDIAFFAEDPFALDSLAVDNNVTAIIDCGVAPGMSSVLIGHIHASLDRTTEVLIYVGGLPEVRTWPYEYKAVFSPIDVIEEYTRPARYVENGHLVTREALSDAELLDFPGIGTLEAFNSDGLRTLARTIDAPNMKEKTLRYQGHIEKMAVLRATGMFSEEPVDIKGSQIRPIDVTAKLLFPMWEMQPGDVDITVLQVLIAGEKDGKKQRHVYDMMDRLDPVSGIHSMARTTGYTATMAIRMLAAGMYQRAGIIPPEYIGQDSNCVKFMLDGLAERGVVYRHRVESL